MEIAFISSLAAAVIAFAGIVITVSNSRVIAKESKNRDEKLAKELQILNKNTSHELEKLKLQIIDLNAKSFFRFSKYHELQLELLRTLSKELFQVEHEFKEEDNKQDYEDLQAALDRLSKTFLEERAFLSSPFQATYSNLITLTDLYINQCRNYYHIIVTETDPEKVGKVVTAKHDICLMIEKKLIEFRKRLEEETKIFLNGN